MPRSLILVLLACLMVSFLGAQSAPEGSATPSITTVTMVVPYLHANVGYFGWSGLHSQAAVILLTNQSQYPVRYSFHFNSSETASENFAAQFFGYSAPAPAPSQVRVVDYHNPNGWHGEPVIVNPGQQFSARITGICLQNDVDCGKAMIGDLHSFPNVWVKVEVQSADTNASITAAKQIVFASESFNFPYPALPPENLQILPETALSDLAVCRVPIGETEKLWLMNDGSRTIYPFVSFIDVNGNVLAKKEARAINPFGARLEKLFQSYPGDPDGLLNLQSTQGTVQVRFSSGAKATATLISTTDHDTFPPCSPL